METPAGWFNNFYRIILKARNINIFSINTEKDFHSAALDIFRLQYKHNEVYRRYCDSLGTDPSSVENLKDIPFIPVSLFRDHKVFTGEGAASVIFSSSGTTGSKQAHHYVKDIDLYERSFTEGFRYFYGDPGSYVILALLPSYSEREGSSLIYMVDHLIKASGSGAGGYYLNDYERLVKDASFYREQGEKIILFGVTYALLELAEKMAPDLSGLIVMETGGMKGKRKEITREELHKKLASSFKVASIHSEYGMTELLSQAYSKGGGIFNPPGWMKVLVRDLYDPFSYVDDGKTGGINIIDLANINSCSFIETSDLGYKVGGSSFCISGRFDNSDIRGCNLLVQ